MTRAKAKQLWMSKHRYRYEAAKRERQRVEWLRSVRREIERDMAATIRKQLRAT